MRRPFLLLCMICLATQILAQETVPPSPIIFIYDASGSMWGQIDGVSKMKIATDVLSESVSNLPDNQDVGLVAYGHRRERDCRDVEFMVGMHNNDKSLIHKTLSGIRPLGRTPLAYSAMEVINKLRPTSEKATIILVTDGIESCDGNICEVVQAAKDDGIDFKLHIIGFGLRGEETTQLQCAAKAGGGHYYDADNADELSSILNEATESTIDQPEGNFSVYAIKNGEPIDAIIVAYQAGTSTRVETGRTYRDSTFIYLAPGSYDLEITPLENSDVSPIMLYGVESTEGQIGHRTVRFDSGTFRVFVSNNGEGWDAAVQIYSQDGSSVARGRTYGREDEYDLNPGMYDIEVSALGLEGSAISHRFEDITLTGGEVVEIEHDFKSGTASIGVTGSDGLVDAMIRISDAVTGNIVASGRSYTSSSSNPRSFTLTPGIYNVNLEAVSIYGLGRKHTIQGLQVSANEITRADYQFRSGTVVIGATSTDGLVDAMVQIVEPITDTPVAAARTYSSESSNPRQFQLIPGTYQVSITALGAHNGKEETITIVVEENQTTEQIITF